MLAFLMFSSNSAFFPSKPAVFEGEGHEHLQQTVFLFSQVLL